MTMDLNIRREILESGIALLLFDRPNSVANIFDQQTFDELNAHLDFLESEKALKGLIIQSAKPKIFIAGADLNGFTKNVSAEGLAKLIEQGQNTFNRIEKLPCPTVAAIHGVALGGGLEIALACDFRIATSHSATKLGLPETNLGILPAWGGSTRLPKLIGLPNALDAILPGRQFTAETARKLGIVDAVVFPERLKEYAIKQVMESGGKKRSLKTPIANHAPISNVVRARAEKTLLAKTRGNYPAPLKALDVAYKSLTDTAVQSLENEKNAFIELVSGEPAQNLIRVFFLQERAKKLKLPATLNANQSEQASIPNPSAGRSREEMKTGVVVGAGLMGAGIAQWLSSRGIRVILKDIGPEPLGKGMQSIAKIYREAEKRYIFTSTESRSGLDRILPTFEDIPLKHVDFVIEAAIEKLELKQKIFCELEQRVPKETLIASNTSALSIDSIASSLQYPDRVVGLHFFNPVHRMQLVEIVRGEKTSVSNLERALRFVKGIGKLPVLVKDSPGFLVNRILLPYMIEAVHLFQEGYRTEMIDNVMLDFGMPMGPLRLADEVGLDVSQHVALDLTQRLPHLAPVKSGLEVMVAKGWLGRKSGKGFYQYSSGTGETPNPQVQGLQPGQPTVVNESDLRDRLTLIMVNEAARTLEEKVVDAPEDVDFGMIMGTGWAPFRGGPARFADSLGISTVVSRLNNLAAKIGSYFEPCALLVEMANRGKTFYAPNTDPPKS
jgi:3-hydroxyacyl-CoA dehydrogenase / enoyl-CoA hydratase / 3-hydroxybutyryl-CoA epimerase